MASASALGVVYLAVCRGIGTTGIWLMSVTINDKELISLMKKFERVGKKNPKIISKMLKKVGVIIQGKAEKYAPRSKTKGEYIRTLKGGKTKRKASSFTVGNLKKSITLEQKKNSVEIGVPINAPGGKYAEKMHDEKGKTWEELGDQNTNKATDKYIFKAYDDSKSEINKELNHMLDEVIKGIFK